MRLRITFAKSGALRYIGHLDLQTVWERTVRRAGLPLAYTQGFHPGPRIQIAAALPLGFTGRAEIVDAWLQETVEAVGAEQAPAVGAGLVPAQGYAEALQPAAPPGLTILRVEVVDEHGPALQTQVVAAEYEVTLLEPVNRQGLERKIKAMLKAKSLPRERRGKAYDLRLLIEDITLTPSPLSGRAGKGKGVRVYMRLAAREGATGRPEEVLAVLGISPEDTRIERTGLVLLGEHPDKKTV